MASFFYYMINSLALTDLTLVFFQFWYDYVNLMVEIGLDTTMMI